MTARPDIDERSIDEALAWQAALECDDADWDGYISWLEADPSHRQAFDAVALTSAMVEEHGAAVRSLLDVEPVAAGPTRAPGRRWMVAGGVAAALALAIAVGLPMRDAPDVATTYASGAAASRTVALASGAHVTLSPSSRIIVHGKDAARVELAAGEAYFAVRHDPARVLTIDAGGYRISDIGTRFSVNLSGGAFRVGVAEGSLSVSSDQAEGKVRLRAGQQLTTRADRSLALAPVAPGDIGSWRDGRLSYSDAPLALVAADISRYSGKRILIDPSLETRHFSGTLVIGDGSKLASDLATIMGLSVHKRAGGALQLGGAAR